MHVVRLFEALLSCEDVEVVIAGLPEGLGVGPLGDGELEGLESFGEGFGRGFAEEEVDVLGHEDVAMDFEVVALAGLFEGLLEDEVVAG